MRVVFMGTPDFAAKILERLLESRHQVIGVVCQPDRPRGRCPEPMPPETKVCSLEHGLEVYQPKNLGPKFHGWLSQMNPDATLVAAFGRIIPSSILNLTPHGCINVHPSLLPRYRGAAPIQWALANGDEVSGVSIMKLDEGMDTGDLLMQRELRLLPDETAEELHDRMAELGAQLLLETLDGLEEGRIVPVPQDGDRATLAPILTREDGELNWSSDCKTLYNRIRGFHSWPGTFTWHKGKRLKVMPPSTYEIDGSMGETRPGTFLGLTPDGGLSIACGVGRLNIHRVQLEGKKPMTSMEVMNGRLISVGEILGDAPPASPEAN